jgi:16S rRNA (cytosine1402-N4)-methyltransferase
MDTPHQPVLLAEILDGLRVRPDHDYIDCTIGAGGHSLAILATNGPGGRLLGFDADPGALEVARARLAAFGPRVELVHTNFRHLQIIAQEHGFVKVAGIMLDLGVSSLQLDQSHRGFSFQHDAKLDMRFDPAQPRTAHELVNTLPERALADLIYTYGQERRSRRIARAIVANRPLDSTAALARLIERTVGRRERIHPATRTFQALRIAVNDELGNLESVLPQTAELLAPGGRLAVIAFHSLEDGIVKRFLRQAASDCICPPDLPVCRCEHTATLQIVTPKPITPSAAELARNRRSRSARLRIAERLPA